MKTLIHLLGMVFLATLPGKSQASELGLRDFKALYKATYLMCYQPDSTDAHSRTSGVLFTLFACNRYSFIVNNNWYMGDSIIRSTAGMGMEMVPVILGNLMAMPLPRTSGRIFTDREKHRIIAINDIPGSQFAYTDPLDIIEWQIEPETRKIGNLQTQKATGSFAGRDYIAWFTRQIPLPLGPYKFNGLPGIIVKIEDTRQHYRWELIEFKPARQYVRVLPRNPVKVTTWHGYREKHRNFYADPVSVFEAWGVVMDEENRRKMRERIRERQARRNNPIELRRE